MSRPRLGIGTAGEFGYLSAASGRVTARARYRDWDGLVRMVQATGGSRPSADRALKHKLAERAQQQATESTLSPDSGLPDLVAYWLADIDLEDRISKSTREFYDRSMRTLVLPALGSLTLREIGVARCDRLLKELAARSYGVFRHQREPVALQPGGHLPPPIEHLPPLQPARISLAQLSEYGDDRGVIDRPRRWRTAAPSAM